MYFRNPLSGPAEVWSEALPYAWRVLLAAEHEDALFELVALMEQTPVPGLLLRGSFYGVSVVC